MIMSSFQMSSKARPISTMPATTPATMGMMSGPAGHSEREKIQREEEVKKALKINIMKQLSTRTTKRRNCTMIMYEFQNIYVMKNLVRLYKKLIITVNQLWNNMKSTEHPVIPSVSTTYTSLLLFLMA